MRSLKCILTHIGSRVGWCWLLGHTPIRVEKPVDTQMVVIDSCIYCSFHKTVATRPLNLGEVLRIREGRAKA